MTTTFLTLALVLLAAFAWRRERHWRQSVLQVTKAAGLNTFEVDKLSARFQGLTEAQNALNKEEYLRRLFESLLNEIRQGVVIVDDHQRIKFCNRTMGHLFHRTSIHRGRTLLEEFSDHEVNDIVQTAVNNQRRTVKEIELSTTLGSGAVNTRHYLIEAAPLPAKAEAGAWLMVYDITEQTMAEQVRKDFVANASHELRTPLTLINGYIETLQSGVIKDEASRQRFKIGRAHV